MTFLSTPLRIGRLLPLLAASLLLSAASGAALAQAAAFPSKPLRFIVPVGPGTNSDVLARWVAERTSKLLGTSAIVENKPGGDMLIAMQLFLQAPPDGHTVLMLSPTATIINPLMIKDLPYDAERDIRPVAGPMRSIAAFVVSADSKYKKFADLVADAKARPGAVSIAWYAQSYRIAIAGFENEAKVKFNSIPYRTPTQVTTDMIGGTLDATLTDFGGALQLAKSGKIRVLAITSTERHPGMPEVPTVVESGFPNYTLYQITGFGVHGKTPDDIAKKVEGAILRVTASQEFKSYIEESGAQAIALTGAQMADSLSAERKRYREILKTIGN